MRDHFPVYISCPAKFSAFKQLFLNSAWTTKSTQSKWRKFICSGSLLLLSIIFTSSYADTHRPQEFLKGITGTKDEGQQIYNHFCITCHAQKPMISLGAPKIGNIDDWAPRLKNNFSVLFKNTSEGLNAMPPRGGCFECTDKQLILAIVAMVPKQAQKDLLNELCDHKKDRK